MTRDHAAIEELLAVRSLGGLDGDDVETLERELASHGDCEECDRLRSALEETAGRLGSALEPLAIDPAMADRILMMARGGDERAAVPTVEAVGDELATRRGRAWRAALAVAASFVVAVAAFAIGRANSDIVVVVAQRFVELEGGDGSLTVAYTPGQAGIVVWGQDLPDPGEDRVYELWTIADGTPVPQGCMRPSGGAMAAVLDGDVGEAQQVAVTVEAASCPDAPTAPPVFASDLA